MVFSAKTGPPSQLPSVAFGTLLESTELMILQLCIETLRLVSVAGGQAGTDSTVS